MKLKVFNLNGNIVEEMAVDLTDRQPSKISLQRNVLVLTNNRRIVRPCHYKNISGISGTARKPHPQKRTGRARHGTLRAINMRHGGVKFAFSGCYEKDLGRRYRTRLYMNKKEKRINILGTILNRIENSSCIVIDSFQGLNKTVEAVSALKGLGVQRAVMFYQTNYPVAFGNIKDLHIHNVDSINILKLLSKPQLMIEKEALLKIITRCQK